MDDVTSAPSLQFGPVRWITGLMGFAALVALASAVTVDAAGRFLFAVAAIVLAGYAIGDLVFAPRLVVDRSGLRVHSPLARAVLAWSEVDEVRADARTRYGLRSVTLEIDAGDTLIVLSRRALGADPEVVAQAVRAFDPRGRGG